MNVSISSDANSLQGGLHMTKYREILRLTALGLSLRDIEKSLKVSRKTVL